MVFSARFPKERQLLITAAANFEEFTEDLIQA